MGHQASELRLGMQMQTREDVWTLGDQLLAISSRHLEDQ
jgi:hypothetical protein